MKLITCEVARHADQIRAIFNDAILHSTALYDYKPRSEEMIVTWFETKAEGSYPILGAEDEEGSLMGFASYGPFRAFPAYKYTVEHSVYVDARFRGRGVGRFLLEHIVDAARAQDYHMLVGAIDATNHASIALHEKLGFSPCGIIRQAGFKFGRWLDLAFYQRVLATPAQPVDG